MSLGQDTAIALIDSRNSGGSITLPPASQVQGRIVYAKNVLQQSPTSTIVVKTAPGDFID